MPEVIVKFPAGMFAGQEMNMFDFVQNLKAVAAEQMSAIDPSGQHVLFDKDKHIDLVGLPYDPIMSKTTAAVLLTIVTYGHWEERNANMNERLQAICDAIACYIPDAAIRLGQDAVSATFIGKQPGCWAFAQKSVADPI